jgi:anti-sigma regulatory factor (Ser/Thr protein kinase)
VAALEGDDLLDAVFTAADLSKLRYMVGEQCANCGLSDERRRDFVLAVHEISANAIMYAGGTGRLILRAAERSLCCLVRDSGSEPVPGPPEPAGADTGRGLWLAAQLADELTIVTENGGTTVSIMMRLPDP